MQLCVDTSTSQYHSWRFMYLSNQILWVMIKDFWCWCIPGFVTNVLDISHHPSPPPPNRLIAFWQPFVVPFITCQDKVYAFVVPLCRENPRFETHSLKDCSGVGFTVSYVIWGNKQNRVSEYVLRNLRWWAEVQLRSLFFWGEAQCHWVVRALRFKTLWSSHVHGSNV